MAKSIVDMILQLVQTTVPIFFVIKKKIVK